VEKVTRFFFRPITELFEAKPKQTQITFDTQLKATLREHNLLALRLAWFLTPVVFVFFAQ